MFLRYNHKTKVAMLPESNTPHAVLHQNCRSYQDPFYNTIRKKKESKMRRKKVMAKK